MANLPHRIRNLLNSAESDKVNKMQLQQSIEQHQQYAKQMRVSVKNAQQHVQGARGEVTAISEVSMKTFKNAFEDNATMIGKLYTSNQEIKEMLATIRKSSLSLAKKYTAKCKDAADMEKQEQLELHSLREQPIKGPELVEKELAEVDGETQCVENEIANLTDSHQEKRAILANENDECYQKYERVQVQHSEQQTALEKLKVQVAILDEAIANSIERQEEIRNRIRPHDENIKGLEQKLELGKNTAQDKKQRRANELEALKLQLMQLKQDISEEQSQRDESTAKVLKEMDDRGAAIEVMNHDIEVCKEEYYKMSQSIPTYHTKLNNLLDVNEKANKERAEIATKNEAIGAQNEAVSIEIDQITGEIGRINTGCAALKLKIKAVDEALEEKQHVKHNLIAGKMDEIEKARQDMKTVIQESAAQSVKVDKETHELQDNSQNLQGEIDKLEHYLKTLTEERPKRQEEQDVWKKKMTNLDEELRPLPGQIRHLQTLISKQEAKKPAIKPQSKPVKPRAPKRKPLMLLEDTTESSSESSLVLIEELKAKRSALQFKKR